MPEVQHFFDPATSTLTYVIYDLGSADACVIDPALAFDVHTATVSPAPVVPVIKFLREKRLSLQFILETHIHADHLSAAHYLQNQIGGKVGISAAVDSVANEFKNYLEAASYDSSAFFNQLFVDGSRVNAGTLAGVVMATPGHTPACVSYLFSDKVFCGDLLFMPDVGTGRCDFPLGSAEDAFDSVKKLYALPDKFKIYVGHDYQPGGRDLAFCASVTEQKSTNKLLSGSTEKSAFVEQRQKRDAGLPPPRLLHPSIQTNLLGGRVPEVLRIPVTMDF